MSIVARENISFGVTPTAWLPAHHPVKNDLLEYVPSTLLVDDATNARALPSQAPVTSLKRELCVDVEPEVTVPNAPAWPIDFKLIVRTRGEGGVGFLALHI